LILRNSLEKGPTYNTVSSETEYLQQYGKKASVKGKVAENFEDTVLELNVLKFSLKFNYRKLGRWGINIIAKSHRRKERKKSKNTVRLD